MGQRPRRDGVLAGAVPVLRQAGAVVGALAVLPVRAGGAPRDGGRQRAVEDRGGGLSLRHHWSAARRPDGAPRARRLRPRRDVVVHLAGGGPDPAGDVGPAAVRAGGVPARTVLRQSRPGAAGEPAPRRVVDEHLRGRSAGGPGGADGDERRDLAAPSLRGLRRRAPRPAARGRMRRDGPGRGGRRAPLPPQPRGRLPQQPPGRSARRRPGHDRLRLLGRRAGRLRPQPAPRR